MEVGNDLISLKQTRLLRGLYATKERGRGECVALESREFERSKGDSMLVNKVLENMFMLIVMKEYSNNIKEVIRRKRSNIRKYELKRIPFEIILLMLEEQEKQTGEVHFEKFQRFLACSAREGGFDWNKTPQGYMWWFNTLRKHAPHAINKL